MLRCVHQQEELQRSVELCFLELSARMDQLSAELQDSMHRTEGLRQEEAVVQPHASRRVHLKEAKNWEKGTSAAAWNALIPSRSTHAKTISTSFFFVSSLSRNTRPLILLQ